MKRVEIMDLAKIRAVSSPQISPDGGSAVFVHTVMDFEKDEYLGDLWIADLETGEAVHLGASEGREPPVEPRRQTHTVHLEAPRRGG